MAAPPVRRSLLPAVVLLMAASALPGFRPQARVLTVTGVQATLPLAPFSAIHSANMADYATYQLKLTYLGDQKKVVSSLAGVGTGRSYEAPAFLPYERAFDYGNDEFTGDTLVLAPAVFKAFVDAIAANPALTDTSLVPEPNASLMILRDSGPATLCWEHLADRFQTEQLFLLLRDQVPPADTATVSDFRRQMSGVMR